MVIICLGSVYLLSSLLPVNLINWSWREMGGGEQREAVGESLWERNNSWIVESVRNKEVSRYWCVSRWLWLWLRSAPVQVQCFFLCVFFVLLDYLEMAEAAGCGGVFAVHLPVSARTCFVWNLFFFFFFFFYVRTACLEKNWMVHF